MDTTYPDILLKCRDFEPFSKKLSLIKDVTVNAKQGNHPSTSADNEHSTESSYWKQDIIISTILPEVEDSTYSLYYDRKSTEQNKDDSGIHGKTETELSSRELFLFGLFAAGLVLVLCVSVICNACINRKCKTGISQRNKRTAISNVDLKLENSDIIESDEITSLYEKINEDEMLPQSAIALRNNVRIAFHNPRPKPLVDLPENPYFEITEYYLEPVHQSDSDKAKQTLTIPNALLTAEHIQNSSHCFETNEDKTTTALQDSSDFESFTDECFSDKKPTDDGYLKPYVALNTNEMDYLHSYSTPILHQTLNTTACLDSSVQIVITDDYVDAFSPKQ